MYPKFLAIGAAILLLSPVNALTSPLDTAAEQTVSDQLGQGTVLGLKRRSTMELKDGPRFGLPATYDKVGASHHRFDVRDFLGFLTGGSDTFARKQTTGGRSTYTSGGAPPMRQEGGEDNEGNDGDRQAADVFDEGDDQPDHHSHGGHEAKRSLLAMLTKSQSGQAQEEEDQDGGREAKRSLKALRRGIVKRSLEAEVFKTEMNLDGTLMDAEKLVNGAVTHTQSTVNGIGKTLLSHHTQEASTGNDDTSKTSSTTTTTTDEDTSTSQGESSTDQSQPNGQSTTDESPSQNDGPNPADSEGGDDAASGGSNLNPEYFD
ncbi:hypothetical protein BC941DRAFT_466161 [Chlamydoabsidia padenii]|nr:hypothetical protein BC941DRAFT_466161 [Chlamydoabsidia padenii]